VYCAGSGYVAGCGAALLCDVPAAACCVNGNCQTLDPTDCANAGGIFQGFGSDCGTTVCGTPPANDDCNNPAEMLCGDTIVVDNTWATTQIEEINAPISCIFGGPNPMAGSVWYVLEGTGGTVEISTCNSTGTGDTVLVVYSEGSPFADCTIVGLEVACNDDACGATTLLSKVCVETEIGVNYLVGVGTWSDADRGEITINVTCPCPEGACCFSIDGHCEITNETSCQTMGGIYQGDGTLCAPDPGGIECPIFPDTCEGAEAITCDSSTTFDQAIGTSDPTDPTFSCHFAGPGTPGFNSAWFTFVATDTSAVLSTCASPTTTDTLIGVYDGTCGSLVEIACNEDACGATGFLSEMCVSGLTVGETYYVQVAAFSVADAGVTQLDLTCPCPAGACCFTDGTCSEVNSAECITLGGTYQGDGTECASTFCPDCSVTCPGGATLENEPLCGIPTDSVNGGCNGSGFTAVTCGTTVCGSGAFDGALRDTDWYVLTLAAPTNVTLTVESSHEYIFGLIADAGGLPSTSCATAAAIQPFSISNCATPGSVCVSLPAGTSWWFIGRTFTDITACGSSPYVATWSCGPEECPGPCPGQGNCFEANGTPGCEDEECCNAVCAVDPFCCDSFWDGLCAGTALEICEVVIECPTTGDCFTPHANGGCDDGECCSAVCALDSFCCVVEWDALCVQTANCICEGGSGSVPLNDECSGATLLSLPADVTGDTTCALPDVPPAFTCVTSVDGPGVWYQVLGTGNTITASTCNPGNLFDTKLHVYCNACDALVCVTGNDDDATCAIDGFFSTASFCTNLGDTYYIFVSGWGGGVGTYQLTITDDGVPCDTAVECAPPPPLENDNCADRIEILDGATPFSNAGATTDGVGDGLCLFFGNNQIFNDIWYNYTATCDGTLTVSTCGSAFDTKIAVYDGTSCPTGAPIACNDDNTICGPGSLQSQLDVAVVCGQTYKIRVGSFDAATTGSGTLTLTCNGTPCPAGCAQDCVTSATLLPPPDGIVDGADLAVLIGAWGACPGCCSDSVTSATLLPPPDGVVDGADLAVLIGAWGNPGCQ